ncbi:hypothetical protein HK100_011217 [Physocladia obscura]|uniref:Methyltransferase domain-containing protein n=1 Tax=Physocladia obscura TaxID=109957 RepID=A0AAD5T2H6_9FUNG|nr:hypothetical protein HK100_011217 [Physocladia obscura]
MGPHMSRTVKENTVSKISTVGRVAEESTPSAGTQSPNSAETQNIKLVTGISDDVDFTREYHGVEDSNYLLPSDIEEQDRLELQHFLLRHLFKGDIVRSEIRELAQQPGYKILDVGCANGWWLDSIAKTYPLAELHGVDLAPSVIEKAEKFLPNVKFISGNVITGLPYADNTFDFVHQRYLFLGLPGNDFPTAIRELMRVTKSGGWIELVEVETEHRSHTLVSYIITMAD